VVITGLEKFISDSSPYKKRRIALIANQSSLSSNFKYTWDLFRKNNLNLVRIFSPEHGLFGSEQDQVPVKILPETDIEVVSLYGNSPESLMPQDEFLKDIDLLIYDIQDVGARYYTYLNTMIFCMKKVSRLDIEFMVFDRPNPLGGETVEGPILDMEYKSFVGMLPITVRHGLTSAEIALFAKDYYKFDLKLSVIKMEHWHRNLSFKDTGLSWVGPSPNMPLLETVNLYPGICLFEGLNISEGRGTTTPFEVIGADFIDPYELADYLNNLNLEGIIFRPIFFRPVFHKYNNKNIGGVYMHLRNNRNFKSFYYGIVIVKAILDLYNKLEFLTDVYEFTSKYPIFDLLAGNSVIRECLLSGESSESIQNRWHKDEIKFLEIKKNYHLY
jgi:uncharacterized protein YbbC (DUF1343 family)